MIDLNSLNFDQPQDEEAAIKALAEAHKPRFIIVERNLAVQFHDGQRMLLPLDVPQETAMKILNEVGTGQGADINQLQALLEAIGHVDEANKLAHRDLTESMVVAAKYFELWAKLTEVSLGEPKSSAT